MKADPHGVLTGTHFIDGDHACCEGALAAGARFAAGYPITPSTEVVERFAARVPTVGGTFIQMEDELAASITLQGAVWGGAKAFNLYKAIKSGYFQTSNPDLITIGFGMNDCVNSNAGDLTNYITYINFAISYFYQKNPNVSIVLIGPNATNDATRTPTIGNFRAALASIVAAPPVAVDIKYYDSSTAFFVGENDALYFRDTEVGTSAMIHPSGVGSTLIGNGLYTVTQTTKFYKNAIA